MSGGKDLIPDERRLAAWESRMNPVIVSAAIVPIVVALTEHGKNHPAVWIDLASWLIFIADLVVHLRLKPNYLRSTGGRFDLVIVVMTAPWYLIPGLGSGRVLGLARLGRLGRVFVVSTKSKKLAELRRRLGQAAVYSTVLILCCAVIVKAVEPATSGYEDLGTAVWWAVVTFTTVGYGDFYPVTTAGRIAAIFLMLGGVALIGSLAGTLGSFFRQGDEEAAAGDMTGELLNEVRLLRAEIAEMRLERTQPPVSDDTAGT